MQGETPETFVRGHPQSDAAKSRALPKKIVASGFLCLLQALDTDEWDCCAQNNQGLNQSKLTANIQTGTEMTLSYINHRLHDQHEPAMCACRPEGKL